jgi:uncharacterized membrane protein
MLTKTAALAVYRFLVQLTVPFSPAVLTNNTLAPSSCRLSEPSAAAVRRYLWLEQNTSSPFMINLYPYFTYAALQVQLLFDDAHHLHWALRSGRVYVPHT